MTGYKREISKEIYERAMKRNRYIAKEDEEKVFSVSEIYGYGVYCPIVHEEDGKYYVYFKLGDSCD